MQMRMRERAVSDLQKKKICFCTVPYPELRNRKTKTMTVAAQAVLRAVVRAFRAQAEIIDSISTKKRIFRKESPFFAYLCKIYKIFLALAKNLYIDYDVIISSIRERQQHNNSCTNTADKRLII